MGARTDLKVGFACNNRCVFCAQGEKRGTTRAVPFDELVEHLRRTYQPGTGLVLTGGEPTVRRDLARLVASARSLGYRPIQVQTNGRMLMYRDLVARLCAAGVTEFSPALHGPTAEIHDALTRAPGSFEQTTRGIANAVASGANVVTNTVVARENLGYLVATVEKLHALGCRHQQLALVHPVGTAADLFERVVPRIGEAARAIAEAVRAGRALGVEVVVEAVPPCLLRGVEDAVVEERIPFTTVVDIDGQAFAFSDWRREEGKAKGPPCESCARRESCEGPWREYPQHHGWDEYVPYAS